MTAAAKRSHQCNTCNGCGMWAFSWRQLWFPPYLPPDNFPSIFYPTTAFCIWCKTVCRKDNTFIQCILFKNKSISVFMASPYFFLFSFQCSAQDPWFTPCCPPSLNSSTEHAHKKSKYIFYCTSSYFSTCRFFATPIEWRISVLENTSKHWQWENLLTKKK